jgi:hypothetical protein
MAMGSRGWGWFAAWVVTGAGLMLGLLSILTIGIFVLPVALGLVLLLSTRAATARGARAGAPGIICGLAVPLLWVAFLNRSGPGTVCETTAISTHCTKEWSPWPWLGVAVAVLALGVGVFLATTRRTPRVTR